MTFGTEATSVRLRDTSYHLSFLLQPVQRNIGGMVLILEQMKICLCYRSTETETTNSIVEKWSNVLETNKFEMRVRSPACKHISFYSKVDHCQVCIEKCKRAKKRETSASVSESTCTKPKVGKFEATSSNTPLRNLTNMCTSNGPASSADSPTDPLLNNTKDDTIDKLLSSGAPEKFKLFLEMQLQNSKTELGKRQRKWDPEFISFCLSIYVRSPRIYRDLRDSPMLVLPSESLLRMYKNCIKQKPGINEDNLTWMKKEAERQNVSDFGKRGGLIVDEMSIQNELQIVRKGDAWSIVGGVDMGQTDNIISTIIHNQKKTELATYCLQFLFHGVLWI